MSIFKQAAQGGAPTKPLQTPAKKPSPFSLIMASFKKDKQDTQQPAAPASENSSAPNSRSVSPVKGPNPFNFAITNLVKQATDLENMIKILQTTDPSTRTKDEIRVDSTLTQAHL